MKFKMLEDFFLNKKNLNKIKGKCFFVDTAQSVNAPDAPDAPDEDV